MRKAAAIVDQYVPDLPVEILASFGDAVFNSGPKITFDTTHSTAPRKLVAKDYAGACK